MNTDDIMNASIKTNNMLELLSRAVEENDNALLSGLKYLKECIESERLTVSKYIKEREAEENRIVENY